MKYAPVEKDCFLGVYELARISTNYMIFKICDTEYKTIFLQAK